MKILLKILVAPFALALSLLAALLVFLFDICAVLLTIASVILAVLGVAPFFTPTPIGGIVFLSPFSFRRMGCKRRLTPFFGRWTEANPLCTGFWQVKQPRAILARSRGGLDGPPFFIEGRDDFWLPQLCCSAMQAKAKRLPRLSGIVWTMAKTRRKQKAESISPLMSATPPPWRTSFFWRKPAMPP